MYTYNCNDQSCLLTIQQCCNMLCWNVVFVSLYQAFSHHSKQIKLNIFCSPSFGTDKIAWPWPNQNIIPWSPPSESVNKLTVLCLANWTGERGLSCLLASVWDCLLCSTSHLKLLSLCHITCKLPKLFGQERWISTLFFFHMLMDHEYAKNNLVNI